MALGLIETEYFVCSDSDDAMTDNALERMLFIGTRLPTSEILERSRSLRSSQTGEVIGDRYPEE